MEVNHKTNQPVMCPEFLSQIQYGNMDRKNPIFEKRRINRKG